MQVNDDPGPEEVYDDEDDENDENNWRNDYPEEEEFLPEEDGEKGTLVINAVCFPAVHVYIPSFLHAVPKKAT